MPSKKFQHVRPSWILAPGVPACNGPETIPGFAQNSLDVMFSRQLFKDWAPRVGYGWLVESIWVF